MKTNWRTFWLGLLAVILAGLATQIATGQVPIPPELAWLAPIAVGAIVWATPKLREMAAEDGPEDGPETDSPPLSVPIPPRVETMPRYPQWAPLPPITPASGSRLKWSDAPPTEPPPEVQPHG